MVVGEEVGGGLNAAGGGVADYRLYVVGGFDPLRNATSPVVESIGAPPPPPSSQLHALRALLGPVLVLVLVLVLVVLLLARRLAVLLLLAAVLLLLARSAGPLARVRCPQDVLLSLCDCRASRQWPPLLMGSKGLGVWQRERREERGWHMTRHH